MVRNLLELFRYTELIKTLVGRNLKVRYRNSVLGYAWTLLDPLLTMLIFVLVFDLILRMRVENFPVYLLTGLVPWLFFSTSVISSVSSIISNVNLIKRVYYPREIFPLTLTLSNGINMLLSLAVLIPVILAFGLKIHPHILLLPVPMLFLFLLTFGLCMIFSSVNVFFRDMSHIAPFVLRLWFYLTPIFYVVEGRIPAQYLNVYMVINPLAVILSLFRTYLMGHTSPPMKYIITAYMISIVIFCAGYLFFKKNEDIMVKSI